MWIWLIAGWGVRGVADRRGRHNGLDAFRYPAQMASGTFGCDLGNLKAYGTTIWLG
jgi:hypothetical protein